MPVDIIDLSRLIGAIVLLLIPGYLWSFLFLKQKDITRLERVVFGFVLSISMFVLAFFTFDLILNIPITQNKTILLYTVYTAVILILFAISIIKKGMPNQTKQFFASIKTLIKQPKQTLTTNKTVQIIILLAGVLIFAAYIGFLPHLKDSYFLPFHVDEWIH